MKLGKRRAKVPLQANPKTELRNYGNYGDTPELRNYGNYGDTSYGDTPAFTTFAPQSYGDPPAFTTFAPHVIQPA